MKKTGSLAKALSKYKDMNASLRVGVLEDATYPNGVPVAMVAFWNEYGATANIPAHTKTINRSINEKTGEFRRGGRFVKESAANFQNTVNVPAYSVTIPPRPFFRTTVSNNKKNWVLSIQNLMKMHEPEKAMGLMGEHIKDQIVQSIIGWSDPPNAPYTVKKKGFNNPLIQTGQLSRSISYEVNSDES